MAPTRLSLALDKGLLVLPDGPVGFWNAPEGFQPPVEDAYLSQAFAPVFDQFRRAGFRVTPTPEGQVAASVVFCHRAREATLDLLSRAMELTDPGGLIVLEGDKTDGVDSAIKALKSIADVETYAKAHGKLAWMVNLGRAPDAWRSDWRLIADGFQTWPGIFSADGVDGGSALLASCTSALMGRLADFGAGWGYLSHMALSQSPEITSATLIEADFHAAEAARRNVMDPRAEIIWGDVQAHVGEYDVILCNPPFHTSRKPDPEIGRAFLRRAATCLAPKGALWCVANRTLPYETTLAEHFRSVETITENAGFKVLHARIPTRTKQSRPAARSRVT